MAERTLTITHPIGETGRLHLSNSSGSVRITGIEGDTVEILARYRAPGGVDPSSDPLEDGVLQVAREPGALRVSTQDPGGSGAVASLVRRIGAYRPDVQMEVRMPRGARLRYDGVSCDAALAGLVGDQELHTVSGDLTSTGCGGRMAVTAVSGDVSIAGDVLWLSATTTSGDIAVDAELIELLAARSVSGDVSVRAALGRDAQHTYESVSGDLQLDTPSGLTVELSGLSGAIRSELPTRKELLDGRKVTIIGDGGARVRVRTVSGDMLVGARGRTRHGRTTERFGLADEMAAFGQEMAAWGVQLARDVSAPRRPGPPVPPSPPAAPPAPPRPEPTSEQLTILRALESGEIDVDEAARRLEALR
jgi:hypothetical protein